MRTVPARRPGGSPVGAGSPLGALPALGRSLLEVLAVLALLAGIVAMHSLGLGHGPMVTGGPGMPETTGTTGMAGMGASPSPHRATAEHVAVSVAVTGAVTGAVTEVGDPAHGMAAMCLAVLPLLVLLLARLLGFRVRALAHAVPRHGWGGFVPSNRAPPAHLRPSLLKLCILRT